MIRVLLVDDHTLLRQGTRALLRESAAIEVVAECADGAEALALAGRLRPDVVLLDIRLPGMSGIDVARALRQDLPEIKVVILTAWGYQEYVRTLFAIGVHGYLLKTASGPELIAAVEAVQRGEQVLDAETSAVLATITRTSGIGADLRAGAGGARAGGAGGGQQGHRPAAEHLLAHRGDLRGQRDRQARRAYPRRGLQPGPAARDHRAGGVSVGPRVRTGLRLQDPLRRVPHGRGSTPAHHGPPAAAGCWRLRHRSRRPG